MSDAGTGAALRIEAPAPVRGLALVAAGTRVSALLAGFRVASWSSSDGRALGDATYRGPPLTAGAVSPVGDRIAIATRDGAVRVVDASTLAPVAEMRAAPSARADLAFSGDGSLLAGFAPGRHLDLMVWKVASGAPLTTFRDPALEPAGIAFHPGGRLAAVSILTGDVVLLDLASGRPARTLSEAQMAAAALSFSPDGAVLVAASFDGAVLAWDTARWGVRRLPGIPGANGLAISPDGKQVVVSRTSYNPPDTPAEVRLVELRSGKTEIKRTLGIAGQVAVAFPERGPVRVASARGTSIDVRALG